MQQQMSTNMKVDGYPRKHNALVTSMNNRIAVLTNVGINVLTLDPNPHASTAGYNCYRSHVMLNQRRKVPLELDEAVLNSLETDIFDDTLRKLQGCFSFLYNFSSMTPKCFIEADWAPIDMDDDILAVVSEDFQLLVYRFKQTVYDREVVSLAADLTQMWNEIYIYKGRIVDSSCANDVLFLGMQIDKGDVQNPDDTNIKTDPYIWCESIDEYCLGVTDLAFIHVTWSLLIRPEPWHLLLCGVTKSGVLVFYSFNPADFTFQLVFVSYICAQTAEAIRDIDVDEYISTIKICDINEREFSMLVCWASGKTYVVPFAIVSLPKPNLVTRSPIPILTISDNLVSTGAVWNRTELCGYIARGSHLLSFTLYTNLENSSCKYRVKFITSTNDLPVTGLVLQGNQLHYCTQDCKVYHIELKTNGIEQLTIPQSTNDLVFCHGIFCSKNSVIIGVLETSNKNSSGHLTGMLRLMCTASEHLLFDILADNSISFCCKEDVLEEIRHVYNHQKKSGCLGSISELLGITSVNDMSPWLNSELVNLQLLRFLLQLIGNPEAAHRSKIVENIILLKRMKEVFVSLLQKPRSSYKHVPFDNELLVYMLQGVDATCEHPVLKPLYLMLGFKDLKQELIRNFGLQMVPKQCAVCDENVLDQDLITHTCPQGHMFYRCMFTSLPVTYVSDIRQCRSCKALALNSTTMSPVPASSWYQELVSSSKTCLFCESRFICMRQL